MLALVTVVALLAGVQGQFPKLPMNLKGVIPQREVKDCTGFNIDVQITPCEGVDSIVMQNVGLSLKPDCKAYSTGCVNTTQAITSAKISVTASTEGIMKRTFTKSDIDGCTEMEHIDDNLKTILDTLNIPTSCPIPISSVCGSENTFVDLSKHKNDFPRLFKLVSSASGRVESVFDNGNQGCFDFKVKLSDTNLSVRQKKPSHNKFFAKKP